MSKLLDAEQTLLLVIDIQEKFRNVLFNGDQMIENTALLIKGCRALGVPVLVSEQYPQGLGSTVSEIQTALEGNGAIITKTSFGCCDEPGFEEELKLFRRNQILVCGIESHICVNQTVVRLLELGFQVHLIEDAIGSRYDTDYQVGLNKMTQVGALSSCVEMALFELMRSSSHPQFKTIQQLVK